SLVRGKSPVPYQSGVTRAVGRQGIEPRMSDDGWITASCAAMARPTHVRSVWRPTATLRCLCSRQGAVGRTGCAARSEQARKVSNPRLAVLETAAPPLARAFEDDAHDVVRVMKVRTAIRRRASSLP